MNHCKKGDVMKAKIITEGYRLNGYDALYEKTTFLVRERYKSRRSTIWEVTEVNSGITFIYEVKKEYKHERKPKKSK